MYRFISILYIAFLGAVSSFSPSSTTILAQPRQYHLINPLKLNNDSSGSLQSRLYMSDAAGSYLDSLSVESNDVGEEEKVCNKMCTRYAHFLLHCLSHYRNSPLSLILTTYIDWQNIHMVNTPTRSYSLHINIAKLSLCIHPTGI